MKDPGWIVIPQWDRFQHPDVARNKYGIPPWIRVYTELMSDDAFLTLTFHQRGVLVSIWCEYAASHRQLRGNTATVSRRLGHRVTTATLEALNHAGFITFSASKPLATRLQPASTEERREEKEDPGLNTPSYEGKGPGSTQSQTGGTTDGNKPPGHPEPPQTHPDGPLTDSGPGNGTLEDDIRAQLARAENLLVQDLSDELPDEPATPRPPSTNPRRHPSRNGQGRSLAPTRTTNPPVIPIGVILDTQPEEE